MRIFKILLLAEIWILSFALILLATDVSGPVSGMWTLSGSPYNVIGQLNIPAGQELVIEPGVQVIFQGWYKFLIYGRLQAIGTEADTILFTAADTSHGWHGLRFYDINTQPDSSRLVYCKITYGKSSSVNSAGDDKNGGAIFCSNSGKLRIEHCLIAHNRTGDVVGYTGYTGFPGGPGEDVTSGHGGGIFCTNSSPLISENSIVFNRTGDATGGLGGTGVDFTGWNPVGLAAGDAGPGGQGQSGGGGAIYCQTSSPIIYLNNIAYGYAGAGVGGGGGEGGYATNNSNWGFAMGGDGGVGGQGIGGSGGAICFSRSGAYLLNNAIYGNSAGSAIGGNGGYGGGASAYPPEYVIPGDGGNGGDGQGGAGSGIYFEESEDAVSNVTLSQNAISTGQGGLGGLSGGWPGIPGMPGLGFSGRSAFCSIGTVQPLMSNSIIWGNPAQETNTAAVITYSCVEGGYPGIGNVNSSPLFIGNPLGDFFLSQIAAGQIVQSPCVDAGHPDSAMIAGTTRTDAVQDQGIVDMGYHYPFFTAAPALYVAPQSFNFLGVIGSGNPQDQIFQIGNVTMGSFDFQVLENEDWLAVTPMSGGPVPPTSIETVSVNIDQLSAGNYAADIVVLAPLAQGSPDTVHINVLVGDAVLSLSEDSLTFLAGIGGGNPPNHTFTISNSGIGTLNYSISETMEWLTVSSMFGGPVPPAAVETVMVDIIGLPVGTYDGEIVVNTPWGLNSPDTVHTTLIVGEPILEVQPDSLVFYTNAGGGDPPDGYVNVMNSGSGGLLFYVAENLDWLSVSPQSGGPVPPTAVLAVSVDNSGFGIGTYTGDINIIAPGAIGSPQTVSVIVHVSAGLSGPLSGIISAGIYNIFGQISVPAGDSLFIEPAVTFKFQDQYGFNIMGYLSALGTETDSIKFILDPLNPSWSGIKFLASADSCHLRYCLITGSNSSGISCNNSSPIIEYCSIIQNTTDDNGGGIFCQNSNPRIANCIISNNIARNWGGGVSYTSSNPTIQYCTISDNITLEDGGGGICSTYGDSALISNCLIAGNHADYQGGGLLLGDGQTVEDCIIIENSSSASGGGICLWTNNYNLIGIVNRCLIEGNTALNGGGIHAYYGSYMLLERCTISRNTATNQGGGVYFFQAHPTFDNCIFYENNPNGVYFGIYQPDTCITFADFYNAENFAGYPPEALGQISTTNFNGDSCDVYNNIFLDPLFANPDSGDYHLSAESPCIDAGDPASPLDPDSTIADMGAFYFDQTGVGVADPAERFIPETFFLEGNHPNPFNPTTTITFGLPVGAWVKVEVFDIAGRVVRAGLKPAPTDWFEAGVHEVTFDGSDLPSGIYLLRLRAGDFSAVKKIVLLK